MSLMYRVCRHGKKIHFKDTCPHYKSAEHLELCSRCTGGKGP